MLEPLLRGTTRDAKLTDCPIEPSWIEAGAPRARAVFLSSTDDRLATSVLWECTGGRFTWRYAYDETIYILDGGCVLKQEGVPEMRLRPGDSAHFSRGAVVTWTVDSHVRKIAFFKSAAPRPISLVFRILKAIKRRVLALVSGGASDAFGIPAGALAMTDSHNL
jgi:uncharacterized cupin superfamily protein